jgi:hypothetical protein
MGLDLEVSNAIDGTSMTVTEACEEFLAETRLQRAPKTFMQYTTALAYFQRVAGQLQLDKVGRRVRSSLALIRSNTIKSGRSCCAFSIASRPSTNFDVLRPRYLSCDF